MTEGRKDEGRKEEGARKAGKEGRRDGRKEERRKGGKGLGPLWSDFRVTLESLWAYEGAFGSLVWAWWA